MRRSNWVTLHMPWSPGTDRSRLLKNLLRCYVHPITLHHCYCSWTISIALYFYPRSLLCSGCKYVHPDLKPLPLLWLCKYPHRLKWSNSCVCFTCLVLHVRVLSRVCKYKHSLRLVFFHLMLIQVLIPMLHFSTDAVREKFLTTDVSEIRDMLHRKCNNEGYAKTHP